MRCRGCGQKKVPPSGGTLYRTEPGRALLFRLYQREAELVELRLVDAARGVEHHIAARIVLREGDVIADRVRAAEERAQAVEAERKAPVGRCAV